MACPGELRALLRQRRNLPAVLQSSEQGSATQQILTQLSYGAGVRGSKRQLVPGEGQLEG